MSNEQPKYIEEAAAILDAVNNAVMKAGPEVRKLMKQAAHRGCVASSPCIVEWCMMSSREGWLIHQRKRHDQERR